MKSYVLYPMVVHFFLNVGIFTETRSAEENHNKKIVCVFNAREGSSTFIHPYHYEPEDVPTELCTHVVYHALEIDIDMWELENPTPPSAERMRRLTSLGAAGPLKFLLRVWNEEDFPLIAADPSKRLSFVSSALRLIRDYGFNGLDIYWMEADPKDRENYVKLVEEFVEAFKPPRLLLTISFDLEEFKGDFNRTVFGYDIQRLSELVDWIHVDAYRRIYYTADCHSPLYRRPFDAWGYEHHNVHDGLERMVRMGAPRRKLLLELTFRGKLYKLTNPNNQHLDAPAEGDSFGGPVTGEPGNLAYFEICRSLRSGSWTRRFDHVGMCPYAFHGNQWVSYEDEQSIRIKMNYVNSRGFGGAFVSNIQYDDFNGFCGSKNQLLRTVHDVLLKEEERTVDSDSMESVLRKRYEAMGIVPIACNGLYPHNTETRSAEENHNKKIVCVYNGRNHDMHRYVHPYHYEPEDVPTELCTDVVYEALDLNRNTWEMEEPPPHSAERMRRLTSLGAAGPLKFLLRVWTGTDMSDLVADPTKRLSFVSSALRFIWEYGFNGLDIYWYFVFPKDRENYVKLVEELVEAFKPSRLLLTIKVDLTYIISLNNTVNFGYDIQRMSELVDWIHVGILLARFDTADCLSPLYRRPFDVEDFKHLNVHEGMEILVRMGAPRRKLLLELSFRGKLYTLTNPNHQHLNTPAKSYDAKGPVTGQPGLLAYFEICPSLRNSSWTRRFDHVGMCPYAFHGDQWVSYEDEQSIRIKMNYVRSRGFGGACVSEIEFDDFNGFCGSENHLLRTVHDTLLKKEERTVDSDRMESVLRKRYEAMGIVPIACNGL